MAKADDMSAYDTVFIGFPIWWYREPSIIDTFFASLTNLSCFEKKIASALSAKMTLHCCFCRKFEL